MAGSTKKNEKHIASRRARSVAATAAAGARPAGGARHRGAPDGRDLLAAVRTFLVALVAWHLTETVEARLMSIMVEEGVDFVGARNVGAPGAAQKDRHCTCNYCSI